MNQWTDGYWWSKDGLRLHYRDYAGPTDHPPILCIPGLTRNARDFEQLAEQLAARNRVIVVELRGRGESAYARDTLTYVPLTYVQDLQSLFEALAVPRFIAIGTSLGGILSLLIAATDRGRLAGIVLNDVGPQIEAAGLDRIRSYVGKNQSWPTWVHAARALEAANRDVFPAWTLQDWLAHAKRLCRLSQQGRVIFDYDMKIAEPFNLPGGEAGVDLWPTLDAIADIPALLIRGAHSDILSAATAARMVERVPGLALHTLPDVGHAPLLTEPAVIAAIEALVEQANRGAPRGDT